MSYKVKLGDIAHRHDERTGDKYIYSLTKVDYTGYDEEYIITERHENNPDYEEVVLSLWSKEAQTLADLIKDIRE